MRKIRREVTRKVVEAAVPVAKRRVLQSAGDTPATTAVTSAGPLGCGGFDLDEEIARVHGCFSSQRLWKPGSLRSGSRI